MYNTTTMILLSLSLLAATRLGVVLTTSLAVIRLGEAGVREGEGRCSSSWGATRTGRESLRSRGWNVRARVGKIS